MNHADEVFRMFRIFRTCFQMLKDRQYLVTADEVEMTFDKFRERFHDHPTRDELTILASRLDDIDDQIFVFFVAPELIKNKISNKTMSAYYERMKTEGVKRSILVLPLKLGSQTIKSLQSIHHGSDGSIAIETFHEPELMVNITEHILVPRHQLLTKEEKRKLQNRYMLKELQLPKIQSRDPVARYLGLVRGDVVRIIRASETAGRYVTYRVCI